MMQGTDKKNSNWNPFLKMKKKNMERSYMERP